MMIRLAFLLLILLLLVLSQRFWLRSLWRSTERTRPWVRLLLRALFVAAFALIIISFSERFFGHWLIPRGAVRSGITSVVQLWIFTSFFAFLLFGVVRGIEWLWERGVQLARRGDSIEPRNQDRRAFFRYAARVAAAIPLVAGLYGFAAERFRYTVRKVEVPIADLPAGLDGFQIVQLSDIHSGDYMPLHEIRRAVGMANELGAHVAVITGDFVSNEYDPLEGCIAELSRLRTPLGVFGCNGNHEIYAQAEDRAEALFKQHGMTLLRHQNREIEHNGAKLNLIGVDYQRDNMVAGPHPPMLNGVEALLGRGVPNILLSHNPNSFNKAAELGIELSLAGHTHGGQVKFEILDRDITPARFITDFPAGLFDLPFGSNSSASNLLGVKRAFLYVNRGLGTFALPARLGVDPEITLLTLRRA
jgi:uncharacterized protein